MSANAYCSNITENTIEYCKDSKDPNVSKWNGTIQSLDSYDESINFLFYYSTNSIKEQYTEDIFNNHINNFCDFLNTNLDVLLSKGNGFELNFIRSILNKLKADNNKIFIDTLKNKLLNRNNNISIEKNDMIIQLHDIAKQNTSNNCLERAKEIANQITNLLFD